MFDKLEDLLVRFEEVLNELGEPGVTDNQERFQKLMKEQSELQPIVDAYKEYKDNKETIQDSLSMLEEEKDEEKGKFVRKERYSGECSRSFYVGENVTENEIKAKFKNGTLTIEIPKKEEKKELPEKKYIPIE